jgi:hypothetical protein
MDECIIGGKRSKFNRNAQKLHQLSSPDIQNQTNHLLGNSLQLESDLTLTVSTGPPRITSVNLLLNVTQVKSASLLLHVTEGTSMSPVTRSSDNKCQSPVQSCQIGSLLLHDTHPGLKCTYPVKRYSGHMVKSSIKRCQIGSVLLHDPQVSSVHLLSNVTQTIWLSPVRRYSDQMVTHPVKHCQIRSLLLHLFQVPAASGVYWLACWPLVPKIAGSNPAEKIHSMPSFGGGE